jgi:hypothetical protein
VNLRLDHVVHAVASPAEAARSFASALEWHTVPGGRHVHWGTYNTLFYFDGCYLEWVGVFDESLAERNEFGRWLLPDLARGEGISQLALRTRDIQSVQALWDAKGLPYVGPVPGERHRDDGTVVRWKLLFPARLPDETAFPLPFLIEWEESDEVREAGLVNRGALPGDAADRWRLSAVYSWVRDLGATADRWNQYFAAVGAPAVLERGELVVSGLGPRVVFQAAEHSSERQFVEQRGERTYRLDVTSPRRGAVDLPERTVVLHGLEIAVKP